MIIKSTNITRLLIIILATTLAIGGLYLGLKTFNKPSTAQQQLTETTTSALVHSNNIVPLQERPSENSIIVKRQLFGPPPQQPGSQNQSQLSQPQTIVKNLDIVLMGTIGVSGDDGKAIILDKQDNKQQIYQKGDAIRGIFIKKILRGRVLITRNGKDGYLEMNESMKYTPNLPKAAPESTAPRQKATRQATKTRGISSSS